MKQGVYLLDIRGIPLVHGDYYVGQCRDFEKRYPRQDIRDRLVAWVDVPNANYLDIVEQEAIDFCLAFGLSLSNRRTQINLTDEEIMFLLWLGEPPDHIHVNPNWYNIERYWSISGISEDEGHKLLISLKKKRYIGTYDMNDNQLDMIYLEPKALRWLEKMRTK